MAMRRKPKRHKARELTADDHSLLERLETMLGQLCAARGKRKFSAKTCGGTELEAILVAVLAFEKVRLHDHIKTTEIATVHGLRPGHYVTILNRVQQAFKAELVHRETDSQSGKTSNDPSKSPGNSTLVSFESKVEKLKADYSSLIATWNKQNKSMIGGIATRIDPGARQTGEKLQNLRAELKYWSDQRDRAAAVAAHLHRMIVAAMDIGLAPRIPNIRIGCGLALVPRFVPDLVRDYRTALPEHRGSKSPVSKHDRFEITVTNGVASELRMNCDAGHYDLVVTSFSDDEKKTYGTRVHAGLLDMHLLFDRKADVEAHPGTVGVDEFKELIRGRRIVLPGRSRTPTLRPPAELLMTASEVIETDLWFEALAMIKSSTQTCCIAFPQLYPSDVRSRYKSFALDSGKFPAMRLGVMKSKQATEEQSRIKDVVEGLFDEFSKLIDALSNERKTEDRTRLAPTRTAHLSTSDRFGPHWVLGHIDHLVITPDGYLRGTHNLEENTESQRQSFSINGHLSIDEKTQRNFLVWRGYEECFFDAQVKAEIYSACVSREGDADPLEPMVGSWSGRTVDHSPTIGYLVLYHESLHDKFQSRESLVGALEKYVIYHREKNNLQLQLPNALADLPGARHDSELEEPAESTSGAQSRG